MSKFYPVYFHLADDGDGIDFYFCTVKNSEGSSINVDTFLEDIESQFGEAYEDLVEPGEHELVGYVDPRVPEKDYQLHKIPADDIDDSWEPLEPCPKCGCKELTTIQQLTTAMKARSDGLKEVPISQTETELIEVFCKECGDQLMANGEVID